MPDEVGGNGLLPFGHAGAERQQGHMYGAPSRRTIGLPVAQGCTARMEEKADVSALEGFGRDLPWQC